MNNTLLAAAALAGTGNVVLAGSVELAFTQYTGDVDPNVVPGQTFTVCVEQSTIGSDTFADFTFSIASVADGGFGAMTNIYFESTITGLGDAGFLSSSGGVNMDVLNDPGGNIPGQPFSNPMAGAFAVNPVPINGINAGESLTIRFDVIGDFFTTGLDELLSGTARIVLKLQSIDDPDKPGLDDDGSAHFITTVIPLPSAGLLAGVGLCGVAFGKRRR